MKFRISKLIAFVLIIVLISFYLILFTKIKLNYLKIKKLITSNNNNNNDGDLMFFNFTANNNDTNDSVNPELKVYLKMNIKPLKLCQNNSTIIFAYVMINVNNLKKRESIRRTWANSSLFSNLKVAFVIGLSNDLNLNEKLIKEHKQFDDLIQGNFLDTYRNLTYKSLIAWKWITNYCTNAKYIIKIDDDLALNSKNLINYLTNDSQKYKNTFFCDFLTNGNPHKDKSSKWYVKDEEYNVKLYKLEKYPTFCLGPSYTMTSDLIKKLYKISFYVKLFWLEDVYTGLLASKIKNVNYVRFTHKYILLTDIANQPNNDYVLVRNVLTDEQLDFAMKYLNH